MTAQVIKYKLPLRIVQNCHITLNNVVVSSEQRLPKANDFATGVNVILKHSRIFVCWVAVGLCLGVYDNVIKYISNRRQFGQPISGKDLFYSRFPIGAGKTGQSDGKHTGCFVDVFQSIKND
jgi:alkylation response protein AidB-like acyl-CoA dehydrogenase